MASNYRVHRIGDGLYNGCHHDAYYQTDLHGVLCTRFWWLVLAKLYKHEEKMLAEAAPQEDESELLVHETAPAAGVDADERGYALG